MVPKEFFVKERRMYSNWHFAFWRELFQNSTDAKALRIRIFINQDAQGVIRIEFEDDGHGMSREVLEKVYFRLGSSTKNDGSTVGGFGRARILTCFSMKTYQIHTLTSLVKGDGGTYEIEDVPNLKGCRIIMEMEGENINAVQSALDEYLGYSQLSCRVIVNDKQWTGWSYRRQMTRFLEKDGKTFASVYVNKSAANNRLLVRVNGTVMYSQGIRAKAQVIVEVEPNVARDVLNANRDGMHYKFAEVLNSFVEELAANTTSALKSRLKDKSITVRGKGLLIAVSRRHKERQDKVVADRAAPTTFNQSPTKVGMGQGSLAPLGQAGGAIPSVRIAEVTGDLSEEVSGTNEFVQMPQVGRRYEPQLGDRFLTDLPDIFVVDDTENELIRKVIESYNPQKWVVCETAGKKYNKGGNLYKLLMLWKAACQHAIDSLMESNASIKQISWGLGWIFSDTATARCAPIEGGSALLLNPVDSNGKLLYSLRSKKSQKRLMALAKHEVAHTVADYHDETFAGVLTDIDEQYDEKEVFRNMAATLADGI